VLCALIKNIFFFLFFLLEGPVATCDNYLAQVKNTNLFHVPVRTAFQLYGASPHLFGRVHSFMRREFPDRWTGIEGVHSLIPSFSIFDSSGLIFWVFLKSVFIFQKCKM
jgi:hypothetical protein